jgi:uncharacterized protein
MWQPWPVATDVLPVRRVSFEYPEDFDPAWAPHLPEFAAASNVVSLMMPYAEPLFIRAVRSTFDRLDDQQRAAAETYIRQEVGHHTQHKRFNELVVARYPSLARIERLIAANARWVWRRSPRFRVAYAAGGETISYGVARWTEKNAGALMDRADPVAATLYLWHLGEEVEHKASTYDVFEATDGSRLRYAAAMACGFVSISLFTVIGTLLQLGADRRLFNPVSWWRMLRLAVSMAFTLVPVMVVSAMPGHHPREMSDPVLLVAWLGQYDEATGTLPLWGRGATSAPSGSAFEQSWEVSAEVEAGNFRTDSGAVPVGD